MPTARSGAKFSSDPGIAMKISAKLAVPAPVPAARGAESSRLDARGGAMHIQPMSTIRTVCVYCGSSPGTDRAFMEAARRFGEILAIDGVGLVYGGGSRGLMGAVASSVLDHGGHVTGIIPGFLQNREQTLRRAQEIIVTPDMHVRKQTMFDKADAFVALPGGIGTLEELVEQLTWAQLGRHCKPIVIANIKQFWDPLLELIAHMKRLAFIRSGLAVDFLVVERVEDILPRIAAAAPSQPVIAPEKAVERM